jgi:hypothetical protein
MIASLIGGRALDRKTMKPRSGLGMFFKKKDNFPRSFVKMGFIRRANDYLISPEIVP